MIVVAIIPEGQSDPSHSLRGDRAGSLPSPAPPRPSQVILAALRVPLAPGSALGLQTASGRSRVPFPSTRRAHGVGPATRRRLAFPISALDRKASPTGSHNTSRRHYRSLVYDTPRKSS